MAAYVVESPHPSLLTAQDDQAFTRHVRHKIIACSRELALMPDALPLGSKDFFALGRKTLLRDKVTLRKRFGPGGEGVGRFAKLRHLSFFTRPSNRFKSKPAPDVRLGASQFGATRIKLF